MKALSLAALASLTLAPDLAQALPTEETHTRLGDFNLRFKPGDIDVAPRLSGGKLGLRTKGEWLDTELSRRDGELTYGLRGRLQGQATTYGNNSASVNLEAFRRWEGKVYDQLPARMEVSGGTYRDLLQGTTSVGLQLRQELQGGNFTFAGQPLSWALDARQGYSVRVQGHAAEPRRQYHYAVLLGVQRNFETTLLGKKATISLTVGPELRGNQDEGAHLAPRARARVRF